MRVSIDLIKPNPQQPRKWFDQKELLSLAASIESVGVLQPLIVEPNGSGYILQSGERRLRASKLAGLQDVPVVLAKSTNEIDRSLRALIENIQRADLNPIEEAEAFQSFKDSGYTVRWISTKTGKSQSYISNRLILIKVDPEIKQLIREKQIFYDHRFISKLLRIPDSETRILIVDRFIQRKTTHRSAILALDKLISKQIQKEKDDQGIARMISLSKVEKSDRWNMLAQVGEIPVWSAVQFGAELVCSECVLSDSSSPKVCEFCPGVLLLAELKKKVDSR